MLNLLKIFIKNEVNDALKKDLHNLDEFSGGGAGGYALPLGANPTDYGAPGTTSQRKRAFMTASKPYGIKKKSKKKSK